MHDIKWIRENPEAFDAALKRRGIAPFAERIVYNDAEKRAVETRLQNSRTEKNAISKEIGIAKSKGDTALFEKLMKDQKEISDHIKTDEENVKSRVEKSNELSTILESLPNLLAKDVPEGADENANVEIKKWGEPKTFDFEPKDHIALGEGLDGMDFETAAKMSGSRFVLLSGPIARLERALAQFMLDLHTQEHGFTECAPPYLVRENALYGTGQLPKFEEDLFKIPSDYAQLQHKLRSLTGQKNEGGLIKVEAFDEIIDVLSKLENNEGTINKDLYLIPTAEVSLTNIVADSILPEDTLPRRYAAHTPCFRSEAGAAGKDTKGMIRQHQFSKVEMVSITHPDQSEAEHERMTACAEKVLEKLGLPYRRMLLCAGDTGFSARKTYDLEVWLPGQNTYREISSCSNCGDFQARRMKARFRPQGQEKGTEFVHTLNGSGVAVGRALIAVLENYQQADGSIIVPDALIGYMGGLERIEKKDTSKSEAKPLIAGCRTGKI